MGEDMGNDEILMPYISSANIAVGYHAGGIHTIQQTLELCLKYHVSPGAHPSYLDKKNFGRTEMDLPVEDIYDLVTQQLVIFTEMSNLYNFPVHHVKPHGALYNQSAKKASIAKAIASAVKDFDHDLILYGLSGSFSISEAEKIGLKTSSEVFGDRTYQDDGSLTSRIDPLAMIDDNLKAVAQVLEMVHEGKVTTVSGKKIPVIAETVCIHGDGKNAVEFAKAIHDAVRPG